jgi:hypothetical protein
MDEDVKAIPFDQNMLLHPDIWIGDSAATVHMSPHATGMVNIKKSEGKITVGNGAVMMIKQTRDVPCEICNKEGQALQTAMVTDVTLTQGSPFNLFSLTKMMQQGWSLGGDKNVGITLSKGNNKLNFDIPIVTPRGVVYGIRMRRCEVKKEVMMTRTATKEDENPVELNAEEEQNEDTIYDEPNTKEDDTIHSMDTHDDVPKNDEKSNMNTQDSNQKEKLYYDEESKKDKSNMDTRTDLDDATGTDTKTSHTNQDSGSIPTHETKFKPNYRDIVARNLNSNPESKEINGQVRNKRWVFCLPETAVKIDIRMARISLDDFNCAVVYLRVKLASLLGGYRHS